MINAFWVFLAIGIVVFISPVLLQFDFNNLDKTHITFHLLGAVLIGTSLVWRKDLMTIS